MTTAIETAMQKFTSPWVSVSMDSEPKSVEQTSPEILADFGKTSRFISR